MSYRERAPKMARTYMEIAEKLEQLQAELAKDKADPLWSCLWRVPWLKRQIETLEWALTFWPQDGIPHEMGYARSVLDQVRRKRDHPASDALGWALDAEGGSVGVPPPREVWRSLGNGAWEFEQNGAVVARGQA